MEITELPVVATGVLEDMFGAFYNELWSQFLQKLFAICASEVWPALPEMLIGSLRHLHKAVPQ